MSWVVSLNDMASLLDWDLHQKVFPTVRYLVQRRRAKVVDLVRSSLKSIFTLPTRIETPYVGRLHLCDIVLTSPV
jgi:nitrogen permease regulator 3